MKKLHILSLSLLLCASVSFGAIVETQVTFDSGSVQVKNQSGTALSGGTAADGNGTVIQLGYFTSATTSNNFLGNWVPLSGQLSLNTAYSTTSIGDTTAAGAGDGTFGLDLFFIQGDLTKGNSLPGAVTIPLAIRFFNSTTIATSTFYNTVSDDLWLWKLPATPAPTPPQVVISLDHANLEWESIAVNTQAPSSAFKTSIPTIAAPEPASTGLLMVGLVSLAARRRRPVK